MSRDYFYQAEQFENCQHALQALKSAYAIDFAALQKRLADALFEEYQRCKERDSLRSELKTAREHDEQMNTALGKLAPKGTWLCEVLENIWRAPNVEEASVIADKASEAIKDQGFWTGPRIQEQLQESHQEVSVERRINSALREQLQAAQAKLDMVNQVLRKPAQGVKP